MKKKLVAILTLCVILCASIMGFAACSGFDVNPNGNGGVTITPTPTPNTPENNQSNPTHVHSWIIESIITEASCTTVGSKIVACECGERKTESIPATGHTEVVDQAVAATHTTTGLTEGMHCSVCKEVLIEQEVIPVLEANHHSITYRNIKTAQYPAEISYAEHTGLLDLPEISVAGYKFLGWYTASIGGDIVDYIPANSTKDYVLFAHWEIEQYAIQYVDAPITNNPDFYTIEDEITLRAPEWSGLSFAYWKDQDGNECTGIAKGTTGAITLTAHWRYKEELAIPTEKDREIFTAYDEEKDRYHFIYELGVIDDIILETIISSKKDYGQELSWSRTTTITMEENIAETVSKSIGENVTTTQEWSNTTEWATSRSETKGWSNTVGLEINFAEIVKVKGEGTQSGSTTNESSWAHSTTTGGSSSSGTQIENAYSSTVSYVNGSSKSLTETRNIPANMPTGTYTYAYVGTAKVYVIITYDVETKDYYVDTYSILENDYNTAVLYELSSESEQKTNIVKNAPLNVKVPVEEIGTFIDCSWYKVQYDANGGEGTMLPSMFYDGITHSLYPNQFTRTGYSFVGWATESNGEKIYNDKEKVTNLVSANGQEITLYAVWKANSYTISFNANGGSASESSRVVTYGASYGSLPTPTRTGYTFGGWYNGNTKYESGTWSVASDVTLTAKWTVNTYTVTFNANGGSVSTSSKTVAYDATYGTLPTPTRTNYAFVGWKLNSSTITSGTKVTTTQNHTLVAEWTATNYYVVHNPDNGYPDELVNDEKTKYNMVQINLDINKLKSLGYTKITVFATVDIREAYDGYQDVRIENTFGENCYSTTFTHGGDRKDSSWGTHSFSFTIDFSRLTILSNGGTVFTAVWTARKNYDDWYRGTTTWNITALK